MNESPVRKNIRLKNYDYSSIGYYFITICVKDRKEILWSEPEGACIAHPSLSIIGEVVEKAIRNIPNIYKSINIDKYVIMPNHIHFIMIIGEGCGPDHPTIGGSDHLTIGVQDHPTIGGRAMRAPTISTIVNQMKGYVSKQLGYSIWQKLFYDHVIRSESEYQDIWQYIDNNPVKWDEDCYYNQSLNE